MYSVDFADIESLQHQERWNEATELMIAAARHVEQGGADFLVICTNTMHKMADEVEKGIDIPLFHIADATAEAIKAEGLQRVGLLGTRFTMEEDFYRGRLIARHGLDVIIPTEADRKITHRVIYDELCQGQIESSSKQQFRDIIDRLVKERAQAIILGCTEIGLLIHDEDSSVPLFDTTRIHAVAAVDYALASSSG
jgi:aspartate racemase